MAIDSTADLLFNIGMNSDDAVGNMARLRTLMGKDLDAIGGEFSAWSTKLLGDLGTVKGAMIATGAVLGTGLVAAAGFAMEAAHKYSEFVDEVARGSKTTGISAENMSKLHFAAQMTGTSYDSLTTGLTRFASTVVKANQGNAQAMQSFLALGISQEQVKAGEKDLNGLLMVVADRFHQLGSRVLQTAEARELFSRGGPELVKLLSQGSAGLREMGAEAEKLGLVIGAKDVAANNEYKASIHMIKAEIEGFVMTIGKEVLPAMTGALADMLGLVLGVGEALKHANWTDYLTLGAKTLVMAGAYGREEADRLKVKIAELAKSLAKFGDENRQLIPPAEDVKEAWRGIAEMLEKVKEKSIDVTSVEGKQAKELAELRAEIEKTTLKFAELQKQGKLDPKNIAEQMAAMKAMDAAVMDLLAHQDEEVIHKNQEFGDAITAKILAAGEQTYAAKVAEFDREYNATVADGARKMALTTQNLMLLGALYAAGQAKIDRERADQVKAAGEELDQLMAAQQDKTYAQQQADWDREIAKRAEKLDKDGLLDQAMQDKLFAIYVAGQERIDAAQAAAYATEIGKLSTHLAQLVTQQMTAQQRLAATYQKDLQAYSDVELKKALLSAKTPAEALAIQERFAAVRRQLDKAYELDLQALVNSQGWQGVFGGKFGELLRGNEALLKQWATSANQSSMLVQVSLEGLRETGRKTFESLAQGMASNTASAFIHSKSIGEAMKAELESTLENLAAQSLTYAIYSTALGFTRLAQYDPVGAQAAFTAAAIWGSVGAASAVAGRALAGGGGGAAGGAGTGGNGVSNSAAAQQQAGLTAVGAQAAGGGTHVTVNVYGHVIGQSGAAELTGMINDAVLNQDATLTATNTTTGRQVQQ